MIVFGKSKEIQLIVPGVDEASGITPGYLRVFISEGWRLLHSKKGLHRREKNAIYNVRLYKMNITPDLPFLNMHYLFTNEMFSVYLGKHNRMS